MEKHLDTKSGKAKHSGENINSVAQHILDEMFVLLQGCDNGTDSEDDDNDEDEGLKNDTNSTSPGGTTGSRPQGWFFPGFMSLMHFVRFEETISSKRRLDFFMSMDSSAAQ